MLNPGQAAEVTRLLAENARLVERRMTFMQNEIDQQKTDISTLKRQKGQHRYRAFLLAVAVLGILIHGELGYGWATGIAFGLTAVALPFIIFDI